MSHLKDVHTEHCCSTHGCKYGDLSRTECTVVSGEKQQSFPCEVCYFVREQVADYLPKASDDELRAEWQRRGMNLDRAEQTFPMDLPCPSCGQESLFGYSYQNEKGEHMHTHYVCTFWRSGVKSDLSASLHKHCGWHGWTVRYDESLDTEPQRD